MVLQRVAGRGDAPELEEAQSLLVVSVLEEVDLVGEECGGVNRLLSETVRHGFGHERFVVGWWR